VIVEAMASGVPVIGSTCGAIPEVIGDAGLVFPEGDAAALAAALRRLLGDEALREQLVLAGQARVKQYSWDQVAAKTYELFRQVLDSRVKTATKRSMAGAQVAGLGCAIVSVLDCLI
jgi:glycosyltransferase involved in cell wall biosynthesis